MSQILINDLIKSSNAITASKGRILHDELKKRLLEREHIVLNFEGIETSTTRFFHISIGELYREFDEKIVDQDIEIIDVNEVISQQIEAAKHVSKLYFSTR